MTATTGYVDGTTITVSIEDSVGSGNYIVVGGMDSNDLTYGAENVEVTNKSVGGYQDFADFAGTKRCSASGTINYFSDAGITAVQEHRAAGGKRSYKIKCVDGDFITADFVIDPVTESSPKGGVTTQSFTINSAGEYTKASS